MEIVALILVIVWLSGWHMYSAYLWSKERDRLLLVITTEKAPNYTRVVQAEKLAEQFAAFETDDEDDLPDGMVN